MKPGAPGHIRISYHPGSPTRRIGAHEMGPVRGQFLGCVVATQPEMAADPGEKRWYAVLHRFDAAGLHLGSDHFFAGTSDEGEPDVVRRAELKLREFLGRLGRLEYRDIDIALFELIIDGQRFGLVDASSDEQPAIHLVPNGLVFLPPWTGDYST